jgi:hypothetical protein
VQSFEDGSGRAVRVESWQLATPADAYGLYSTFRSGAPTGIGNEGDSDPGRRVDFWKDRYFVRVLAQTGLPEGDLLGLATAVARAVPEGGGRPSLVDRLPPRGLGTRSDIYFHEEISIQTDLWLGGENLLGLGPGTEGVLAKYDLAGSRAQLLVVQYSDGEAAAAGLESLRAADIGGLMAAGRRERLLAAVFGNVEDAQAEALVSAALEGR